MSNLQLGKYSLTIILILVSLLGCSPKSNELTGTSWMAETEDRDFTPDPKKKKLAGTNWELVSLNGKDLIGGTAIMLEFTETYLGGEMSCNGYGGSPDSGKYISKNNGTFQLGDPFAVTVQLCTDPEGIMEQEAEYIDTLMSVIRFQVSGDHLKMQNENGETILVFKK